MFIKGNLEQRIIRLSPSEPSGGDVGSVSADEFAALKEATTASVGKWGQQPIIEEEKTEPTDELPDLHNPPPIAGGGAIPDRSKPKGQPGDLLDPNKPPEGQDPNKPPTDEDGKPKDGEDPNKPPASSAAFFKHWDHEFTQEQVKEAFESLKMFHESRTGFDQEVEKFQKEKTDFETQRKTLESGPLFEMAKFIQDNPEQRQAMLEFINSFDPAKAAQIRNAEHEQTVQALKTENETLKKQLDEKEKTVKETHAQIRAREERSIAENAVSFYQKRAEELAKEHEIEIDPEWMNEARMLARHELNTINPETKQPVLAFTQEALSKFFGEFLQKRVNWVVKLREKERSRHLDGKNSLPKPPPPVGGTPRPKPVKPPAGWKGIGDAAAQKFDDLMGGLIPGAK